MIKIRTFDDYQPYTWEDGTHFAHPEYSYIGSEPPNYLVDPDTLVVHSGYVPADLATGRQLSLDPKAFKNLLESLGVSTHYIIGRRPGKPSQRMVYAMTDSKLKAWHAGESRMPSPDNRTGANHFALSVELIATETSGVTRGQYNALGDLVALLVLQYPLRNIVGHNHISGEHVRKVAPKTDPWRFNWAHFRSLLRETLGERYDQLTMVGDGIR